MGRDYTQPTAAGHIEHNEELDHSMIIDKDDISDDEIKDQIPDGSKIHV